MLILLKIVSSLTTKRCFCLKLSKFAERLELSPQTPNDFCRLTLDGYSQKLPSFKFLALFVFVPFFTLSSPFLSHWNTVDDLSSFASHPPNDFYIAFNQEYAENLTLLCYFATVLAPSRWNYCTNQRTKSKHYCNCLPGLKSPGEIFSSFSEQHIT